MTSKGGEPMNKLIKSAVALGSTLTVAAQAFAVNIDNPATKIDASKEPLGQLFNTVITFLIAIVGGLAIVFLILGGIRYIIAGGDPKATDAAKHQITSALIGLVIALLAVVIVIIVGNFLGAGKLNEIKQ